MILNLLILLVLDYRPTRPSLRTPHTDSSTHHLAEPLTPQRLTLCQCEAYVCQRLIIQFTAKQRTIFSQSNSFILAQ